MIFLFRFDKANNGLDFILNQAIAEDMYPDIHEKMIPLVEATGQALNHYKMKSIQNTVMQFIIDDNNDMEVKLSPGLGQYIDPITKQVIFTNAKSIADLCVEVMNRRTLERREKRGS
ncbi:hypothetical protein [Thermoactinomyces sp. CICC 10521]|uniref:hypothetical protein n=1 Tax=Thermoactinomyces sp. CICC 10521 TaxID=2767426 RepID=UPI0018DC013B|nr:hypothetical protein [Thermoactinomyces sp. CICC 10521]MBH8609382.1 hypothetical protein [Thermoactinomyces sp. CICC 10521]